MSELPSRDRRDEEKFIEEQRQNPNTDQLTLYVTETIQQGRIQLAARLVQLIPTPKEEDPNLSKAMKAAQFWLINTQNNHVLFLDAWQAYQSRKRVRRIKERMRPKSQFKRRRPR